MPAVPHHGWHLPRLFAPEQPRAASRRQPLSERLSHDLLGHFPELQPEEVSAFLYEASSSVYPDAVYDITVYGPDGRPAFEGRQFVRGMVSFWRRRADYTRFTELHTRDERLTVHATSDLYEQIKAERPDRGR